MGIRIFYVLVCLISWPCALQGSKVSELGLADSELSNEDPWAYRSTKKQEDHEVPKSCLKVYSTARDIEKRFYAILPYFDKEHSNKAFLYKFRGTVNVMSQGEDQLDREAGFYATVVTPIVFLQHYRDTWCLLERFHRALRFYQISHPTDKRAALKLLQNLRSVNHKVRSFIMSFPGPVQKIRTTTFQDFEDDEITNKKDIRYLKELIKNLG